MALVKCPECQTSISSAAKACPSCGHPVGMIMTAAGPVTPLQHELAKTAKSGMEGCGLCILGLLLPVIGVIVLGVLGATGIVDWIESNQTLAGMIFFALIIVGGVGWINRARIRAALSGNLKS